MTQKLVGSRIGRIVCGGILAVSLAAVSAPAADDNPANVVAVLKGHTETVYAIAFTPDGKYVVTGSFDKSLKLWEVPSGKEVRTYAGPTGHQNLVLGVAVSADGKSLASGGQDNSAK